MGHRSNTNQKYVPSNPSTYNKRERNSDQGIQFEAWKRLFYIIWNNKKKNVFFPFHTGGETA